MKIAVCVPVHRENKSDFSLSLARMMVRTAPTHPNIEVMFHSSCLVSQGRNLLTKRAREWGADYILWADDDHIFPPDTLLRLLSHNLAVIGCNFLRRAARPHPTAYANGMPVWTTPDKGIQEVETLGLGLCLMKTAALNGVEEPLFTIDLNTMTGEDIGLCMKLRALGVKIHVDHALSWECKHIADVGLGFDQLRGGPNANSVPAPARHQ